MCLRDPERLGHLGLSEVEEEAHEHDLALARTERADRLRRQASGRGRLVEPRRMAVGRINLRAEFDRPSCRGKRDERGAGERLARPDGVECARHPNRRASVTQVPLDSTLDAARDVGGQRGRALGIAPVDRLYERKSRDLREVLLPLTPPAEAPGDRVDER